MSWCLSLSLGSIHCGERSTLLYTDELIYRNTAQLVSHPAWPFDFKQIDFGVFTQPKVDSQVILRKVAASTSDLVDLGERSGNAPHASPDRTPIRFCSHELDVDPVIRVEPADLQQRRRCILIIHHNVDTAVIVEVAKRAASPGRGCGDRTACQLRHLLKSAVA